MPAGTKVDFYLLGSAENRSRLLTACRIAEKACEQKLRVSVLAGGPPEAAELDELLWTFSDRSFVPHGSWPADPEFARCVTGASPCSGLMGNSGRSGAITS